MERTCPFPFVSVDGDPLNCALRCENSVFAEKDWNMLTKLISAYNLVSMFLSLIMVYIEKVRVKRKFTDHSRGFYMALGESALVKATNYQ